jgi:HEAT repeat protein
VKLWRAGTGGEGAAEDNAAGVGDAGVGDARALVAILERRPLTAMIDATPEVKRTVEALVALGPEAVQPLVDSLPRGGVAACAALVRIRDAAVRPLVEALDGPDPSVTPLALDALEQISRSLVRALSDGRQRDRAAQLLQLIGAPATWHVAGALWDPGISFVAAAILADIGKPSVAPLVAALDQALRGDLTASQQTVSVAAWALGRIGEAAADPLLDVLFDASRLGTVRSGAAYALVQVGRPAVPGLLEALDSSEALVRREAAVALGEIGDRSAMSALRDLLHDDVSDVRAAAQRALVKLVETGD